MLNRDANSAKIAALKERIAQLEAALEGKGGSVLPGGIAPAGYVAQAEYEAKRDENALMDITIKRQDERMKQQRNQLSECNDALLKANVGRDVALLKFTRLVSVMRSNPTVSPLVDTILAAAAAIKSDLKDGAATPTASAGSAGSAGSSTTPSDTAAAVREFEFGMDDVAGIDVLTEHRTTIDKQRNKIRKLQKQVQELEAFVTKLKKEFDSPTKRIQQASNPHLVLSAEQVQHQNGDPNVTPAKPKKKKKPKATATAAPAAVASTSDPAAPVPAPATGAAPTTAPTDGSAPATAAPAPAATDSAAASTATPVPTATPAPAAVTGTDGTAPAPTAKPDEKTADPATAATTTPASAVAVGTAPTATTPPAASGETKDAPAGAAAEGEESEGESDSESDGLSSDDDERDDDQEAELKSIKVLSDLKEREHQYRQGRLKEQERGLAGELNSKELLLMQLEQLEAARRLKTDVEAQVVEKEKELERVTTERDTFEARQAKGEKLDDKQQEAIKQYKEKVAALQTQLNGLRQKLKESEAAIRESKLKDQNIAKLRSEIQAMKSQKVTLAKQMTENSEKYREWKQAQELKLKTAQKEMRKATAAMAKLQSELAKKEQVVKQRNAQMDGLQKKLRDADLRNAKNAARQAKDAAAKDVKTGAGAGASAVGGSTDGSTTPNSSMRPPAPLSRYVHFGLGVCLYRD